MRPRSFAAASAAAIVITFAAFYPGLLSPDSAAQLAEAHAGTFSNAYPPLMTALWHGLSAIWPGPAGMLLFQALVFWAALGILAAGAGAGLGTLAIGIIPPVFVLLGTIGGDVATGTALLFAVAMLSLAERRTARSGPVIPVAAALLALFYASALGHASAVATLPLCLWAGLIVTEGAARSRILQSAMNGLAIFLAVTLSASAVNAALTSRSVYPLQRIWLHDLTAVSLDTGELLVPSSMRPPDLISVADLASYYSTSQVASLYCCGEGRFPVLSDPRSIEELRTAWFEAVSKHPRSYFKHRFRVFQQLLGLGTKRRGVCLSVESAALAPWLRNSIFFRGWVYVLLSFGFLLSLAARCAYRRRRPARSEIGAWALASSGVLYAGALFFVSTGCDFHQLWWAVVSVCAFPLCLDARDRLRLWLRFFPGAGALVVSETEGERAAGRRLCLFAHHDPSGRVSEAVVYFVRALAELGLEVRFISRNETLPKADIAKLLPHCSKVMQRLDIGAEFGSWRLGVNGIDLKSYEQLVLASDRVFGPLRPLGPIFAKMKGHDLWGMTDNQGRLQSYFLVFGERALKSDELRRFWAAFRYYFRSSSYARRGERRLSRIAAAAKWRTGAFVEAKRAVERALANPALAPFRRHLESGKALDPTVFLWDLLLREFGFPFLKAELPRLNRAKMANVVSWKQVVESVSDFDPALIELALGDRRKKKAK